MRRWMSGLRFIPMILQAYADAQTAAQLQRERERVEALSSQVEVPREVTRPVKITPAKEKNKGRPNWNKVLKEWQETREQLSELSQMREQLSTIERELLQKETHSTSLQPDDPSKTIS